MRRPASGGFFFALGERVAAAWHAGSDRELEAKGRVNANSEFRRHETPDQPARAAQGERGHRCARSPRRSAEFPGGAFAQGAGPEVTKAILGYIALMDASPLVIAKEKGLFAKHGMPDVEVAKQASWGATRDNIVLGWREATASTAHTSSPPCRT